ncbi:hypothetical protein [Micromonospora sp. Llam0]|uniref:hypothetical protein n=1 Tax=Micromonospora sp. Llam0 TaxID=2485143 RepID=UPI0011CDF047|nr:hypothetical protein [Micromonospora sp. Llam0]
MFMVTMRPSAGSGFWSSPEAWRYRSFVRRRRVRRIDVGGEPEGKGERGRRAAQEFQRQVAAQQRAAGHRAMTGPVALELRFVSTRPTPPAIHRMAKWALDVLEQPGPTVALSADRRPLVYRNDRQVKLLHVSLDQAWPGDGHRPGPEGPKTIIHAQPLRDAVEDLRVSHELSTVGQRHFMDRDVFGEDEEDDYPRIGPPEEWDTEVPQPTGDPARDRFNKSLLAWSTYQNLELAQKRLLIAMDRLVDGAMWSAPYQISASGASDGDGTRRRPELLDLVEQHETEPWQDLLSFPLTLPLPSLPENTADRRTFRDALYLSMEDFRGKWPILKNLVVPIKVTMLVVPPQQGKDLDNLALDVLPAVHEVLRPHIEPRRFTPRLLAEGDPAATQTRREHDQALKRLKSLNVQSVTAYQVVELKRRPEHPPQGLLRLTLGLGDGYDHHTQSLWKRTDRRLWRRLHGL